MEMPLVPVLVDLEREGVRLDVALLATQSRHIEQELSSLGARIFQLAGQEFNVNSPKQLSEVLFEKLKLSTPRIRGKARSVSTAADVLEDLALTHDLPKLILEWRALSKLKGTYIDALPQLITPGHRPPAYVVQPGRCRDRPTEQQRPEPAEHSHPHGARPSDPGRVRRRAGKRPHLSRLLAD